MLCRPVRLGEVDVIERRVDVEALSDGLLGREIVVHVLPPFCFARSVAERAVNLRSELLRIRDAEISLGRDKALVSKP